jgi:hypothetical protein
MKGRVIENMFSTRTKKTHDDLRRPMQRLYALSNILTYEPQVDQMVGNFTKKMYEYCDGPTIDLGQMLLFCITPGFPISI